MASPALVHTTVGRMLFHVFVEELGEGTVQEHHANIYRDLLAAMGEVPREMFVPAARKSSMYGNAARMPAASGW